MAWALLASISLFSAQQFSYLDSFVPEAMRQYNVPGAAVAVVHDGKVVYTKGFGVREFGKQEKVDVDTVFLLASVTKALTGSLAGILVDQGKLDFDRPVIDYLPQFVHADPYVTRSLTMRDLLAQRTGWPAFAGDLLGQIGLTREQVLSRLRYLQPKTGLREVASYSNPGFFVAGMVEAAAGGASWDELMRRELYGPLRMSRSDTTHASLLGSNASRYHMLVGGRVQTIRAFNHDVLGPAGSASSTATDIAKWLQMMVSGGRFEGKQIIKQPTLDDILKRSMVSDVGFAEMPPISDTTGFYYGLGVGSFDYAGVRVFEKGGGLPGVRTVVAMIPSKRAAIAVLSNMHMTVFPEAVRARWLATTLGTSDTEDQKAIYAAQGKITEMFASIQPPANPQPCPYKEDSLLGTYVNALYGEFRISREGRSLIVRAGPMKGSLTHSDGGLFWLLWDAPGDLPSDMTFSIGKDGSAESFESELYGRFVRSKAG